MAPSESAIISEHAPGDIGWLGHKTRRLPGMVEGEERGGGTLGLIMVVRFVVAHIAVVRSVCLFTIVGRLTTVVFVLDFMLWLTTRLSIFRTKIFCSKSCDAVT